MKIKFKDRIKKAIKVLRNKQNQDSALQQLLNFLGIGGKNEKALSELRPMLTRQSRLIRNCLSASAMTSSVCLRLATPARLLPR